jgi:hypothetical protein
MAGFCVSCGAPMSGSFCNQCGARAVAPNAPVQPPPPAPVQAQPVVQPVVQPGTPAAKSSGIGKVLLWVGGIFLFLFLAGAAAAMYGVYWVKHKVANYTAAITSASSDSVKVVAKGNTCRLLSTADLQQILGVPIEKSAEIEEESHPGCAYYTNQEAFNRLRRMAADQARQQSAEVNSRPGPKPDNLPALLKNANEMEGIVKALGLTQPVKDGQVFSFTVERDSGEDAWSTMRTVQAAIPGFEEVSGVGDHAMIGSFGHAFYVQKGDALIALQMTWVPDARARGVKLGQTILGNL